MVELKYPRPSHPFGFGSSPVTGRRDPWTSRVTAPSVVCDVGCVQKAGWLSLDPPNHIPELLGPVWTVPWVVWA